MIPQKIQALFDFIDYLDYNKNDYIEKYVPLCDKLKELDIQRNQLRPYDNYKDRQKYDELQNLIEEEFKPITSNIYIPNSNKLRELKIWSGDDTYASIWNNNYSTISDFKEKFTSEDVDKVLYFKHKYLRFRNETNTDFLCLTLVFNSLDDILKQLFDFFKDTQENEFEGFEVKTIKVSSFEEIAKNLTENPIRNIKFSIPSIRQG